MIKRLRKTTVLKGYAMRPIVKFNLLGVSAPNVSHYVILLQSPAPSLAWWTFAVCGKWLECITTRRVPCDHYMHFTDTNERVRKNALQQTTAMSTIIDIIMKMMAVRSKKMWLYSLLDLMVYFINQSNQQLVSHHN